MHATVSPKTRLFAVLGHPIAHSLSPCMHNAAFAAMGLNALYLSFDVTPRRLMPALGFLRELGFAGINLTIPLKETAFAGLTDLAESAKLLGSVNTIEFTQAGIRGHSTDGAGFLGAFEESFARTVAGGSILVLGCGGAGRAVAIACATAGAAQLRLANRAAERAQALAEKILNIPGACKAQAIPSSAEAWSAAARASDIIVHASSVGMRGNEPALLGPEAFHKKQCVYDLVYTSKETAILAAARSAGALTANGLNMLARQGALSFLIWTGINEPVEVMSLAIKRQLQNSDLQGAS